MADTFDCLVVGVGGQGVVLASRLVAGAAMARGSFVRTAETIGMSQRGGSVATHVRMAPSAQDLPSSMIGSRGANLILAFEPGEAVRALPMLADHGAMVCATRPVVPSAGGVKVYDGAAQVAYLGERLDASRLALVDDAVLAEAGLGPKCLNVLLLGAALSLGVMPFDAAELTGVMEVLMKPQLIPMNLKALELGQAINA